MTDSGRGGLPAAVVMVSLITLLSTAPCRAWDWTTHRAIVLVMYDAAPASAWKHLSRAKLREGAVYPDILKKQGKESARYHKFPDSEIKARECLKKAAKAQRANKTRTASKLWGMASHYISDSFAANHYGEVRNRNEYYVQADAFIPKITEIRYTSLHALLQAGSKEARASLSQWRKSRSPEIAHGNLDHAMSAVFAIYKKFAGF